MSPQNAYTGASVSEADSLATEIEATKYNYNVSNIIIGLNQVGGTVAKGRHSIYEAAFCQRLQSIGRIFVYRSSGRARQMDKDSKSTFAMYTFLRPALTEVILRD